MSEIAGEAADQRWVQIEIRVLPEDVEAVSEVLRRFAPSGVAVYPAIEIGDGGEFAYEELDEPSTVVAALPAPLSTDQRRSIYRQLLALDLAGPLAAPRWEEVTAADWAEEWKRFYTVQRIGRRLVVHPSWEPYEVQPGDAVISLDPGTAFGTAQHETTRLCLGALDRHLRRGHHVIDVGTGSGVLAIAAARLGAASVRAVDVDPDAIAVARRNVELNGVTQAVKVADGSIGRGWPFPAPPSRSADIVLANISAIAVIELMPSLAGSLRDGGLLIASGFLARDAETVSDAAREAGLTPLRLDADGEWRCLVAARGALDRAP